MKSFISMVVALMVAVSPAVIAKEQSKTPQVQTKDSTQKAAAQKAIASTVNINTASVTELTTLSGVGKAKAKAIVDYRKANGKFNSTKDLQKVKGIGTNIIAENLSRLKL